jgi:multiple sugar transport system substrate-binding protein
VMNVRRMLRAAVLLGSLLVAPAGTRAAPATTTLNFWVIDDGSIMQDLVSTYNNEHSAVHVRTYVVPRERFVSRFNAAVRAGTGPDLADLDLIDTPNFTAAGLLVDVTARARRLPFFHRLAPAFTRLATYDGKVFALPLLGNSSVLVYNKTLFRRAGLDPNRPPATWSAIEQDARKISALGAGYYGYDFAGSNAGVIAYTFLPLIWASGGDVLDANGTHATLIATPQVRAALAFYRRLWIDGLVPPGAKDDVGNLAVSEFAAGTVGITILGDPYLQGLENQQDPALDFGVGYIPGQNGGRSAFAGGENVAIVRGTPHTAAAWDFISWCLGEVAQQTIIVDGWGDPVRADMLLNTDFNADGRRLLAAQALFEGRAPYTVPYFALFNDQAGPLLSLFRQAVFDGQIDTAIGTAQQHFTQILRHTSLG